MKSILVLVLTSLLSNPSYQVREQTTRFLKKFWWAIPVVTQELYYSPNPEVKERLERIVGKKAFLLYEILTSYEGSRAFRWITNDRNTWAEDMLMFSRSERKVCLYHILRLMGEDQVRSNSLPAAYAYDLTLWDDMKWHNVRFPDATGIGYCNWFYTQYRSNIRGKLNITDDPGVLDRKR